MEVPRGSARRKEIMMKAIVQTEYGPPSEVLQLKEVEKPTPKDDEVLVKIYASSINDGDNSMISGKPFLVRLMGSGLFKPNKPIPGGDIAGQVEAVGSSVIQFKPGDEVYGDIGAVGHGAFAEYVSVPENVLALKPVNVTYEEAAALPQYALVALQGLRDNGRIQSGHKVLVIGASGGVGTFVVQVAKSFGAEVSGVCSAKNMEMVRSLGADQVIDYKKEDFTQGELRYDLIIDCVVNRSISDYTRALNPSGSYVSVAFNLGALILGPLISLTGSKKVSQLSHEPNVKDLEYMKELVEAGEVVSVIAGSYPLSEIPKAFRVYGEGHPSGKIVITMGHDAPQDGV